MQVYEYMDMVIHIQESSQHRPQYLWVCGETYTSWDSSRTCLRLGCKHRPHIYKVNSLFFWGKEWINMIEYTIFMNKIHRIFILLHIFFMNMQHEKGVFFFLYPLFICLIHKNIKKNIWKIMNILNILYDFKPMSSVIWAWTSTSPREDKKLEGYCGKSISASAAVSSPLRPGWRRYFSCSACRTPTACFCSAHRTSLGRKSRISSLLSWGGMILYI